ncbi:Phosphatidylinositol 4-phosphate 5-kinase 9 (AtPIP5K9) (1-phosphatidylinositol 4-phosphate kinase 9) (Diphosphoinositide kinase 9) (PtdIns(4)P-5-kinase 9), partial [Durusdinium trenchii]
VAFPDAQLPLSPPPPEKLPGFQCDARESDFEKSESGEDSDVSVHINYERHRTDLDALMAHHSSVIRATRQRGYNEDASEDLPSSAHELAQKQHMKDSKDSKEKPSFLSRFFHYSNESGAVQGTKESILDQDISGLDDAWIRRWSNLLEKDGLFCTKIATNGKPYERRLHVDSRNMMVEVHQGRNGTVGISLDDLVDLCKDLESPEFKKFCQRRKSVQDFSRRALILQTPARSFSFLFRNGSQRDVFGHFLVYLLKTRGRGVMADTASTTTTRDDETPSTSIPKDGCGKVLYPNNSCYEGEFLHYMRHGHGVLHLPDGTKHESEWCNDERHGPGKEHWADGTVFSGLYVRGMRHGHGTMTWPEGSRYTGMFERGRANGDGELIRTDNSVYRGQFVQDCMSGYGCMQWVDGVEYKGEFAANKRHGLGKMAWTSGKWMSYEGAWKDGVQHGRGILTDRNGGAYVGHFVEGKLDHWEKGKAPTSAPDTGSK